MKTLESLKPFKPLALACCLFVSASAHPQGCSQCSEQVRQTPARTQSAYRKAIAALTIAATTLCGATVLVIHRFKKANAC